MGHYASDTRVSPERTQDEIRATLRRYGADKFGTLESRQSTAIGFEISGLTIRITVDVPSENDPAFLSTPTGRERKGGAAYAAWEQAIRQRYRALLLAIKAKLEAVECGISTIEQEFMPFVVLPNGKTIAEMVLPKLMEASKSGKLPPMLMAL